jgi:hypothetical protein
MGRTQIASRDTLRNPFAEPIFHISPKIPYFSGLVTATAPHKGPILLDTVQLSNYS